MFFGFLWSVIVCENVSYIYKLFFAVHGFLTDVCLSVKCVKAESSNETELDRLPFREGSAYLLQ